LPTPEVHNAPTLAERIEADSRNAEERDRRAREKRTRLLAIQQQVRLLSQEDVWTYDDWNRFYDGLDDLRNGDEEEDEDEEWAYESERQDETTLVRMAWKVQAEGARPTGVLFYGSSPVLSTTGQLRVEAVRDLIEWSRTSDATHAPIERR
jgi:hypothetical protein